MFHRPLLLEEPCAQTLSGKIDDLGVPPFMETPTCLTCLLPQWIFIGPGCSGDICGGPQNSSQQKHPQLQIVMAMIPHQAYELLDFICFFASLGSCQNYIQ